MDSIGITNVNDRLLTSALVQTLQFLWAISFYKRP